MAAAASEAPAVGSFDSPPDPATPLAAAAAASAVWAASTQSGRGRLRREEFGPFFWG